jgi:hypothetical protein
MPRATRTRVSAVVVVSALACAAVLAGLAVGHNKPDANGVTITSATPIGPNKAAYRGKVLSPKANCKRYREVQLWNADANPDVRIGTTRTGPNGTFATKRDRVPNGTHIYALIETKYLNTSPGHNHFCRVARSAKRVFPHP